MIRPRSPAPAFSSASTATGALHVERGYVRPEDEAPVEPVQDGDGDAPEAGGATAAVAIAARRHHHRRRADWSEIETPEDDDTIRPLPDRLVTELTAHRTLALRDALANDPQVAFRRCCTPSASTPSTASASSTCLEITAKHSGFRAQAPGLAETASAKAIDARHAGMGKQLPEDAGGSMGLADGVRRRQPGCALRPLRLARSQCVVEKGDRYGTGVSATRSHASASRRSPGPSVSTWSPPAGRRPSITISAELPKARILEAVREAKGEQSAQLIDHLKKAEMAKEAERLLAGTGWLPEPLRLVEVAPVADESTGESEAAAGFPRGRRGRSARRRRRRAGAHGRG